jgi:hypothetical protein
MRQSTFLHTHERQGQNNKGAKGSVFSALDAITYDYIKNMIYTNKAAKGKTALCPALDQATQY